MPKLLISLLSVPCSHGGTAYTKDQSLKTLKDCLDEVETALQGGAGQIAAGNGFHAIFAAPEYFFVGQHPTDRVPLSEQAKDEIERHLVGLSKNHPKVLIVPGTIFYEEAMTAERTKQASANLLAAEFSAKLRFNPNALSTPDKVKVSALGGNKAQVDAFIGDFDTQGGVHRPGLVPIGKGIEKGPARRVRNRTYLLLAGEKMAFYDKHSDFVESMGESPDKTFFIPGTNDQCPEIAGFRFGVEICYDHGNGVLKRRNVPNLDFHVVVSDWVGNQWGNTAMANGGYFLHASTNPTQTCIVWRDGSGAQSFLLDKAPRMLTHTWVDIQDRAYVVVPPAVQEVSTGTSKNMAHAMNQQGLKQHLADEMKKRRSALGED